MSVDAASERPKSRRGGRRIGAGRKPKGYVKSAGLPEVDRIAALASPPPDEIDSEARQDAKVNIAALVKILAYASSEAAQITAAKEILDRGFGKPAVEIGGDAAMLPLMMPPAAAMLAGSWTAEIRAEAQKFANLALLVLRKIRDHGASETARASSAKALLDRGLGTVGKARMPEEQRERPLGKKEEASRAAETAATGRYATPSPPRFAKMPETLQ